MYYFQNQLDFLEGKKINAKAINSKSTQNERKAIIDDLLSKSPKIQLLYVTPEMCLQPNFRVIIFFNLYYSYKSKYFVLDYDFGTKKLK